MAREIPAPSKVDTVMFSPPGHVTKEGFFGIGGLRIFMPADAFEALVRELSMRCAEGTLVEALTGLRALYGDLQYENTEAAVEPEGA